MWFILTWETMGFGAGLNWPLQEVWFSTSDAATWFAIHFYFTPFELIVYEKS